MANPQSGYNNPTVIPLVGGLDLQAARFLATPGTLKDCLNYESYSISGYSVVDGIEPYDGTLPCYLRDWVYATRDSGSGNFILGENLKVGDNVFGKVVDWSSPTLAYVITNIKCAPKVGDTITGAETAATLVAGVSGIRRASLYHSDMDTFLAARNTFYDNTLTNKQSVFPYVSYAKNVIPHGLHWFKGKLYCVVDHYKVAFNTGTKQIYPGDHITFSDSNTAIVLDIDVDSGSFTEGNAAGSLLVKFTDDTKLNTTATGAVTLIRPSGSTGSPTSYANAINVTEVQVTDSWGAGIYYANYDDEVLSSNSSKTAAYLSTNRRWYPLDMGWEATFKTDSTCTATGIPTVSRITNAQDEYSSSTYLAATPTSQTIQSTTGYSSSAPLGPNSSLVGASSLSAVLKDNSDSTYVLYSVPSPDFAGQSGTAIVKGFDFSSIPAKSVITGFKIVARLLREAGAIVADQDFGGATFELTGTKLNLLGTSVVKTVQDAYTTVTDVEVGGDANGTSDLWGFQGATSEALLESVLDSSFGVKLSLIDNYYTSAAPQGIKLTRLELQVYYKVPVKTVYAYDPIGKQDLALEIPYYFLEKGQFNPGVIDANRGQGSIAMYNLQPLDSNGAGSNAATTYSIKNGWELRTARGGGGVKIAIFASDMRAAMLPTRSKLEEQQKQFVIINANFYAKQDYEAVYGASGLEPAWQYDGKYFFHFRTELGQLEDTPSHVVYHRDYLCLGYDSGTLLTSVPLGPTNFNSVSGATQYTFGNRITNLLSLNGTGLGVFCDTAVYVLTGDILAATDDNNAVKQVISPYSGALPYTAIDCGTPMFADFRGVSTIETTNKYGDFDAGRVSYKITPFLSSRVNDRYSYQATRQNIMFAKAVKNKNQYRLYCADGLIITCTLPSGDRGYEFTTQQYVFSKNSDSLVPVAMCTGVTKEGIDVIFGSFKIVPDDDTNIVTPSEPERETFVYSIDRGTKFYTSPIKHYVIINFTSLDNPVDFDLLRNVRLECLTYNYFNEYVAVGSEYEPFNASKLQLSIDPASKPIRIIKDSSYVVAKINGRGTVQALEFGGEHVYPGHVLQAMALEFAPGRTQQGASATQTIR